MIRKDPVGIGALAEKIYWQALHHSKQVRAWYQKNKTENMMEKLTLGDDVFNSSLNRMGSFRHYEDNETITVRTVNGLEAWYISDCEKIEAPED